MREHAGGAFVPAVAAESSGSRAIRASSSRSRSARRRGVAALRAAGDGGRRQSSSSIRMARPWHRVLSATRQGPLEAGNASVVPADAPMSVAEWIQRQRPTPSAPRPMPAARHTMVLVMRATRGHAWRCSKRIFAHRRSRRRPAVPDHQPTLRARLHRDHQLRVQALARDVQSRRHPGLRRPRPAPAPCRDSHPRRPELTNERRDRQTTRSYLRPLPLQCPLSPQHLQTGRTTATSFRP